jgi:hypothetical protein
MTKKEYFESNPAVNELYFTSDGQAFYDASNASAHSFRLKDKSVETVSRLDVIASAAPVIASEAKQSTNDNDVPIVPDVPPETPTQSTKKKPLNS